MQGMGNDTKAKCLLVVVLLAAISLSITQLSYAQSTPKPSVPQFTAKYVDHSYTVPANTYIDQYTGQQVTEPSYIVQNETIDISIKNQPFSSTEDIAYLCYNIREKGHFGEGNWTEEYQISNGDNTLFRASNTAYTIISLPKTASNGGQIDFQVKAYFTIGHRFMVTNFGTWTWEESDWSNTQTVAIPSTSTPSPTVPELPWLALLPLCLMMLAVVLVLKRPK
jgi:hypothetical protein